jgi:hypothetical protein
MGLSAESLVLTLVEISTLGVTIFMASRACTAYSRQSTLSYRDSIRAAWSLIVAFSPIRSHIIDARRFLQCSLTRPEIPRVSFSTPVPMWTHL